MVILQLLILYATRYTAMQLRWLAMGNPSGRTYLALI
jgi:hypothetical protein